MPGEYLQPTCRARTCSVWRPCAASTSFRTTPSTSSWSVLPRRRTRRCCGLARPRASAQRSWCRVVTPKRARPVRSRSGSWLRSLTSWASSSPGPMGKASCRRQRGCAHRSWRPIRRLVASASPVNRATSWRASSTGRRSPVSAWPVRCRRVMPRRSVWPTTSSITPTMHRHGWVWPTSKASRMVGPSPIGCER